MKSLKRLATMAKRAPAGRTRPPSTTRGFGVSGIATYPAFAIGATGLGMRAPRGIKPLGLDVVHRNERTRSTTSRPKPARLAILRGLLVSRRILLQPEIGQHLRAEAELAERGAGRWASPAPSRSSELRAIELARRLRAPASRRTRRDPRARSRSERLAQVLAAVGGGRAEDVGQMIEPACTLAEHRLGAVHVALHERQELARLGGDLVDDRRPLRAGDVERHRVLGDAAHEALGLHAVLDEVGDGDDDAGRALGEALEIGHAAPWSRRRS